MAEHDMCICNVKNCMDYIVDILNKISKRFSAPYARIFSSIVTNLDDTQTLDSVDSTVLIAKASMTLEDLNFQTGLEVKDIAKALTDLDMSNFIFLESNFDEEKTDKFFTVRFICNTLALEAD